MCGGDMSPYSVSGAKPKPPNVFLDIIAFYGGLLERWMRESRRYFFLSYAQKVGNTVPPLQKVGGTRKLRLCVG